MKIAREKASSHKEDNATIAAFRDQLNVLQLTSQLEDRLHLQHKEAVQMAREKVAAERAATDAIQGQVKAEEARKRLRNRQEMAAEMRADALRASGRIREAEAQEKQIKVARMAQQIETTLGVTEARALQIARNKIDLEERGHQTGSSSSRDNGTQPRGHIGGVTARHMMGSALDQFRRDQVRDGTAGSAFNSDSLSGRRHSHLRSHFMGGGDGGSLQDRSPMRGLHERNASQQDRNHNSDKDILLKINAVLEKGFFG